MWVGVLLMWVDMLLMWLSMLLMWVGMLLVLSGGEHGRVRRCWGRRFVAWCGGAGLHTCEGELHDPEGGGVREALLLRELGCGDPGFGGCDLAEDVGEVRGRWAGEGEECSGWLGVESGGVR